MESQATPQPHSAAYDLRWYFNREAIGPLRSNFGAMVYRLAMGRSRSDGPVGVDDAEALEASARSGSIARVLRALEPETAEVLWRGFGADWPEELGLLGEYSALAPLTQAAREAHQACGSALPLLDWLGALLAQAEEETEISTLAAIHREARELRARAVSAYLNQRRRIGYDA